MKPVKTLTTLKFVLIPPLAVMFLSLAACTAQQSETPDAVKNAEVTKTGPDKDVIENYGGDGLKIPLDGTSLAAFDASLEVVKRNTDEKSYESLTNAIEYLLIYDLSARRNKEILASNLNGLTGYEIMNKVGWRKAAPGKGDAEIGAADAKIIDT